MLILMKKLLKPTYDHPLYVVDKGYCSYSPEQTKEDTETYSWSNRSW